MHFTTIKLVLNLFLLSASAASVSSSSTSAGLALSAEANLAATSPFLHGALTNYDPFGSVEIQPGSIHFGRHSNTGGAIWSKVPANYTDWQIHAKIRITGDRVGGDGMALWYSKNRDTGPVLGAPDLWTGLGILIDTYDDDGRGNNPAIMGMLNNGTMHYNHAQDGEGQYFAGCLRSVRNLAAPLTLRITYIREMLRVELDDSTDGREFVNCFERVGIKLPAGYYFGVSGMSNSHPDDMELLDLKIYGGKPLPQEDMPPSSLSVDIANQIEKSLANQLRAFMPKIIQGHTEDAIRKGGSDKFHSINDRIKALGDTLASIQHSIASLSEHLHPDPGHLSEDLHHLGEELKSRLDGLKSATMMVREDHATLRRVVEPTGWGEKYGRYLVFLMVQVALLAGFLVVKQRMDKKEKKWM